MLKKLFLWMICVLIFTAFIADANAGRVKSNDKLKEQEAIALGTEVYIYGYPLVTMDMTRRIMTNVLKPQDAKAPMGQFANARSYPDASFKEVTAPNADMLYSIAWLDLSKAPYILHVPNEHGRYYLMPILSGWTNVIASPGTRTTGEIKHTFIIIGPNWHGKLPKKIIAIKSPTNLVWIIGRTYSTGTPEDFKAVHMLQNHYTLTPLNFYGKPYTPSEGTVDPNVNSKILMRDQINAMDAITYFSKLAMLMKDNPPLREDAPMVAKLAKLGIVPGRPFDISQLDSATARGLQESIKVAQQQIMAQEKNAGVIKNGWLFPVKTGTYATDYLQRAYVAAMGLGANLSKDAIYPVATVDAKGNPLNGANKYVIHFARGQLPPVNGFWSLTMYNPQYFFVANPLNRYNLSQRNVFKENPDGSVDLYIQHDSPGVDKQSNWLPAPQGNFVLMFRFYWPKAALVNGTWNPPAVQKVV